MFIYYIYTVCIKPKFVGWFYPILLIALGSIAALAVFSSGAISLRGSEVTVLSTETSSDTSIVEEAVVIFLFYFLFLKRAECFLNRKAECFFELDRFVLLHCVFFLNMTESFLSKTFFLFI